MADEPKMKPTNVSVDAFINDVPDEQKRVDSLTLRRMMEEITGEKAVMWGPTIVGFGTYHYKYDSGREGDGPLLGFSPRKPALTIYIDNFAERDALLDRLGKHTMSKACLYIKTLGDVDITILQEILTKSVASTKKQHPST